MFINLWVLWVTGYWLLSGLGLFMRSPTGSYFHLNLFVKKITLGVIFFSFFDLKKFKKKLKKKSKRKGHNFSELETVETHY